MKLYKENIPNDEYLLPNSRDIHFKDSKVYRSNLYNKYAFDVKLFDDNIDALLQTNVNDVQVFKYDAQPTGNSLFDLFILNFIRISWFVIGFT
jgi:hypothetical protein